jgi:hypothetical protein
VLRRGPARQRPGDGQETARSRCRGVDPPRAARINAALVTAVEVACGTRLWRSVAIAAGIGAVVGGLAGSFANGLCDTADCGQPLAVWMLSSAVGAGVWGALFGSQVVVWGPAP